MAFLTSYFVTDVLLLLTTLTLFIYFYSVRKFNYWKSKGVPHKTPVPFFGNFTESALFQKAPGQYLAEVYNETKGGYSGFYLFDEPCLLAKDPELIKSVLIKDFNVFSDRYVGDNPRDDPAGTLNLFNAKNPDWKELRTKISPVFTSGKLRQMFSLIEKNGDELVKHVKNEIVPGKLNSPVKDIAEKYIIDILMNTVFGINSNCLNDNESHYWNAGKNATTFTFSRSIQFMAYFFAPKLVKPLRFKFVDGDSSAFLSSIFTQSMKMRQENNEKRNDLIDILVKMKKEKNIDDNKLLAQGIIFFTAGFESSSSLISHTLFELCHNLDIQDKLRKELKQVLEKHDGKLDYDVLMEMEYLHMVVSETLRKYPPLPFIERKCMRKYQVPGSDLIIDEGVPVFIPLLGLHYDPKYFPDPEKYDPERFSDTNRKNIVSGSYLPFGTGPHNCIGERFGLMSTKMGLALILSNFEVRKNNKTPTKINLDPKSFLVRSKDGIFIDFIPTSIPAA